MGANVHHFVRYRTKNFQAYIQKATKHLFLRIFSPSCLLVNVTRSVRSIEETEKLRTVQHCLIGATPVLQVRQVTPGEG